VAEGVSAPLSFRDPAGRFTISEGRAVRLVNRDAEPALDAIERSPTVRTWQAGGGLISHRRLEPAEYPDAPDIRTHDGAVIEHERIGFPTYADEWTPTMLWQAADLTLDLADALLPETLGLKDATPFNVLWRGAKPVFVDLLSIEARDPLDALWLAESQFTRTFLLPLAAHRIAGLAPRQVFASDREGLSPEAFVRLCPWPKRWLPPYLGMATLPAALSGREASDGPPPSLAASRPDKAAFMLSTTLRRQRRRLAALRPAAVGGTAWSDYGPRSHYPAATLERKRAFVAECLDRFAPKTAIDLGCNDGTFSLLAAEQGASVIAADGDIPSLEGLLGRAQASGLDILPLHIDLAQPTPASGWAGRERLSFDERAGNAFDMTLALAVIHHLQISARIPLPEVAAWIAAMTRDAAVVEHAGPDDPMVKGLIAARRAPVEHLGTDAHDAVFARHFEIEKAEKLDGMDRRLLLLRKRSAG